MIELIKFMRKEFKDLIKWILKVQNKHNFVKNKSIYYRKIINSWLNGLS